MKLIFVDFPVGHGLNMLAEIRVAPQGLSWTVTSQGGSQHALLFSVYHNPAMTCTYDRD